MRIGITGHQRLDNPATWQWVEEAIRNELHKAGEHVTGVTCLAAGSDQVFAEQVLKVGGDIVVILPFDEYAKTLTGSDLDRYERLRAVAVKTETLPRQDTDERSYLAAGKRVTELSEVLVAVWDGQPARGIGGTADIVAWGCRHGLRVVHIDPTGHSVMELKED